MFCGAFLDKKTNLLILTLKLAPSLVYHGLIRALLSLALKKNDHHHHPLKHLIDVDISKLAEIPQASSGQTHDQERKY